MIPDSLAKLSPDLRARLAAGAEPGGTVERTRVLVRFHGSVERLRELGLEVGNVSAGIATATVPLDRLEEVATAPEIVYVEGSRPLGQG